MAPSDGSPLGDIPDDELSSLVDDVLRSGKHATSPGQQAAPQGAKKSDERLHASVIANKSQASVAPPPRAATTGSDEDRWFFEVRGKQLGPLTLGEVGQLWSDGKLDSTAYCWHAKFSAWIPLAKVAALAKAIAPAEESKVPVAQATALAAAAAVLAPTAAAAAPAGPTVGGAASGENASAASSGTPGDLPAVTGVPASPAEVITFVRPTPRVVVESVVAGSFEEDDFAPRQRMPSWFKQSLLTGLVAGGIMAAIVVGAQRTTSSGTGTPGGTAASAAKAVTPTTSSEGATTANATVAPPAAVTAPPATAAPSATATAELQTHQAPAAPQVSASSVRPGTAQPSEIASGSSRSSSTSGPQEPAAPRVAVRPPTWSAPPPRSPAPPITASAPRPRTGSQNASTQQEESGPQDEFGPSAFAREFKETPPNPPKRTVYIPPAPGLGPLPEQLTTEELEAVAESHQAEVRRCIDAHRPLGGPGEIRMRWTVAPDGTVSSARAITSGLQDGALATCLAGAITTWKFPAHQQQMEPVELPFPY